MFPNHTAFLIGPHQAIAVWRWIALRPIDVSPEDWIGHDHWVSPEYATRQLALDHKPDGFEAYYTYEGYVGDLDGIGPWIWNTPGPI